MGRIIIKQPNSLFCVYSTIVDNFIAINMTRDNLIDFWLEEAKATIIEYIDAELKDIDNKTHMTFNQAISQIKEIHNDETINKIIKVIEDANL